MEIIIGDEEIDKLCQNSNIKKIKVCLLGIDNSGKSTFIQRITSINNFNNFKKSIDKIIFTTGANYHKLLVKFKGELFQLDLWNTSRQIKALTKFFYRDADVILNFYNPFNEDSFEYIKKFFQSVNESNDKFHFTYILIKNKYDLNETKDKNIMISDEEILEYAEENNLTVKYLSSLEKYDCGLEEIIEDCINGYLHKNNKS